MTVDNATFFANLATLATMTDAESRAMARDGTMPARVERALSAMRGDDIETPDVETFDSSVSGVDALALAGVDARHAFNAESDS